MEARYAELEENIGGSSFSPRRRYTSTMRRRGLQSCRRCALFLLIAVGVVILPMGLLYTFEGIENGKGELASVSQAKPDEVEQVTNASMTSISPTSIKSATVSTPIVASLTTAASTLRPTWTELPKCNLTQYVDPLIGTEGSGHCILLLHIRSTDISICRSNYPLWHGKTRSR